MAIETPNITLVSYNQSLNVHFYHFSSGLINPGFDEVRYDFDGDKSDLLTDQSIKDEPASATDVDIGKVSVHPNGLSSSGTTTTRATEANRRSLEELDTSLAVKTKKLCFKYTKSTPLVLNNVSINIKRGSIYGLLGPSGCGKTSLLKCLLDQLTPLSGEISVFGRKPGSKGSLVPGTGVGYMPQETALYKAFTIQETINYFGCLNGMTKNDRDSRVTFLMKFLDLPESNRLIRDLSGGQMRRVSLASALIHSPPLLVLDEPTVGVDPLLREGIWNHLIELSREGAGSVGHVTTPSDGSNGHSSLGSNMSKMTIIITTHYIEEARRADTICLFRNGIVLCEQNPEVLLSRMRLDSLELAFLKICQQNGVLSDRESDLKEVVATKAIEEGKSDLESPSTSNDEAVNAGKSDLTTEGGDKNDLLTNDINTSQVGRRSSGLPLDRRPRTVKHDFDLIRTLTMKGVINLRRNLAVLFFNIVNPAFQIILFSIAIGTEPKGLNVAVYNPEDGANVTRLDSITDNTFLVPFLPRSINPHAQQFSNYSLMFLSAIDKEYVNLISYDTYDGAIESVKSSDTWAAITFPANYSIHLQDRMDSMIDPSSVTNETIEGSSIYFHGDFTEFPIQTTLMKSIMDSMTKYIKLIAESKGIKDVDKILKPLVVMTTVYGDPVVSPDYRDFMTPGFILGITFILAVGLTAISFVIERKEGLLERSYVAGVKSYHILAAHVLIQLVIILLQAALLLIFVFAVFSIKIRGNVFLVYALCILQGVCGMSLGKCFCACAINRLLVIEY